ncbi:DUF6928 family protein [Micromonospora echinaurantiaca]|uniref:DUF6928 family protein n=1 Tax=Micromonospora echinaurantiaca TaxID=47857 RepID=UPI0037B1EECA
MDPHHIRAWCHVEPLAGATPPGARRSARRSPPSVKPAPGRPNQGPYPLPFHPLELGEEALHSLFGFIVEGRPKPDDIDTEAVHLHGFRVTDPSGREQTAREALYGVDSREGKRRGQLHAALQIRIMST